MSSAEARERFAAALMARLFSDEQMRILRNTPIQDDDDHLELENAMETLTPKQVGDSINLMLETDLALLDPGTMAELGKIQEVLRLADGEKQLPRPEQH
jgi:hypothetical protein